MKTYIVYAERTVLETLEVQAVSEEDALEKAIEADNSEWQTEMPEAQYDKIENTTLMLCGGLLTGVLVVWLENKNVCGNFSQTVTSIVDFIKLVFDDFFGFFWTCYVPTDFFGNTHDSVNELCVTRGKFASFIVNIVFQA